MALLEEIFEQAIALPPEERDDYLARACGDDAELRAKVDALVRDHGNAKEFFGDTETDAEAAPADERQGWDTASRIAGFTAPDPAALQQEFPGIEVIEVVGRGGMGAVYKARQVELDRIVALKILPAELASDPEFAERFRLEAQAMARLEHPNIVAVYDFGRTGSGLFFLVMAFIDGVTLEEAIAAKSLSPEEAMAVVPKICDALQFAHQNGIVHRDVKPGNVLIAKDGGVKVTDFGLAKLFEADSPQAAGLTMTGAVMGTPAYMAPEQLEDSQKVDHRADIYSLGVMIYQMLTGELPRGVFDPPSHKVQVDVRLDGVVLKALQQEPERRYQQVSEVKSEVEEVTSDPRGHSAASSGSEVATARQPKIRRAWVAFAFAALILVVVGIDWSIKSGLFEASDRKSAGDATQAGLGSLQDGLLLHYTFEDSTGHTVSDTSGQGNHGELRNAVIKNDPERGRVLFLDGESAFVRVPELGSGLGGFTLSYNLKFQAHPPPGITAHSIFSTDDFEPHGLHANLQYGGLTVSIEGNEGGTKNRNIFAELDFHDIKDRWIQLTTTYDVANKTGSIYLNGEKEGGEYFSRANLVTIGPSLIGAWLREYRDRETTSGSRFLPASLDNFRIYNRALTPSGGKGALWA